MNDDDLLARIEDLRVAVVTYETLSKKALGFAKTILYEDLLINVSANFVIADLAPLAFFNLVEYIEDGDAEAAAARLYARLVPLLECRHRWAQPTPPLDQDGVSIAYEPFLTGGQVFVCEFCTAFASQFKGRSLPTVGRSEGALL